MGVIGASSTDNDRQVGIDVCHVSAVGTEQPHGRGCSWLLRLGNGAVCQAAQNLKAAC